MTLASTESGLLVRARIGILEDDTALCEHLARSMSDIGSCVCVSTGTAMKTLLKRETFDLLLVDWALPDTTGLEVMRWMADHLPHHAPVIFVTSRDAEEDVIAALDAGAVDYIRKPIRTEELKARARAVLRRGGTFARSDAEIFGSYRFDSGAQSASIGSDSVALTAKEFDLALTLFQNLHRPLSRAYLLERVWGRNPDLPTRTLDAHISRVRTKLRLRPEFGYRLIPVYSYGYRLETLCEGP